MNNVEITIIIPVFNEINTLEKLLEKINKINLKKQIIIIDDYSTDGSRQLIEKFDQDNLKKIFHGKNYGKGACIISSQKYVVGEYTIIQDADLEYDPNDIVKIYTQAKSKIVMLYMAQECSIKINIKIWKILVIELEFMEMYSLHTFRIF